MIDPIFHFPSEERLVSIMHRPFRALPALLLAVLLTAFFLSPPPVWAAADPDFKVVGYVPSWRSSRFSAIPYDQVTHLNYAFAIPTAEGGLLPLECPQALRALLRTARQKGVKVLLSVGGWSHNGALLAPVFAAATATPARRQALAGAIITMCEEYGFDGVDMDWEHPRLSDGTYRQYEALMLDLSQMLRARGKLLTSAVICGVSPEGAVYPDAAAHTDRVLQAVDWVHVMAYDGGEGERHSPYSFAVHTGDYWHRTRGLPREKVVLGLPFYGRPGGTAYADLLAAVPEAHQQDRVSYQGREIWYNSPDTIARKTRYALDTLGGVMVWEITQDTAAPDQSLLSAITRTIRGRPFDDVLPSDWYWKEVTAAWEAGLMRGTGGRTFSPGRTLTLAEAVALAARLHDRFHNGSDTLSPGPLWYRPYLDYALEQDILPALPAPETLNSPVTRAGFALLLDRALPPSALPEINTVKRIPDLPEHLSAGPAVYRLYRAGILAGTDAAGSFLPERTLTRAEAAALAVRMADPARRVAFPPLI